MGHVSGFTLNDSSTTPLPTRPFFLLLFFYLFTLQKNNYLLRNLRAFICRMPTQKPVSPSHTQKSVSPTSYSSSSLFLQNTHSSSSLSLLLLSLLMESYPETSVPVGGAESLQWPILKDSAMLGDSSASDGFSEVLLDQYTEVDVSSEWLSSFVEECLSSPGNCFLPPKDHQTTNTSTTNSSTIILKQVNPNNHKNPPTNPKHAIPAKPRGQRKRRAHNNPLTKWSNDLRQRSPSLQSAFYDPPLLEQTYWLADSELLTMPRKEQQEEKMENEDSQGQDHGQGQQQQQSRRCSHCQAQKTPQWRAGPLGPKTLCNACGMRYFKSGRLLPEYRPAKSPTFLSYKHSNSHKKVLQMRIVKDTLSPDDGVVIDERGLERSLLLNLQVMRLFHHEHPHMKSKD
ncbi:hypothetical protein V2J09_008655 [Rumex salicifolius]